MKIHTNQVPVEGLHLEGEEAGNILDIHDQDVQAVGPIRYALDIGLSQGGMFATGNLAVDLELECVCCLEHFRFPLEVADFAVLLELGTSEMVDLTENVREDILLALPPYPHCDWNGVKACSGVRPIMQTPGEEIETEPVRENPWATLDRLNKPKD